MGSKRGVAGLVAVAAIAGVAGAGYMLLYKKSLKLTLSDGQAGTLGYKVSGGTVDGQYVINAQQGNNITGLGSGSFDSNGNASSTIAILLPPGNYQLVVIDHIASARNHYQPQVSASAPFTIF